MVSSYLLYGILLLFGPLWHFVSVWVRTKKGIHKIIWMLKNFLWARLTHNYCCWMAWDQWCEKKRSRGLGLIDLVETTNFFLVKWVLHAFEPRDSNLQCLFKHYLKGYNPHKHYKWPPNLAWCLQRITRKPLVPWFGIG